MQQARSIRSVLAVSMNHEVACQTAPYVVDTEVIQGSSYLDLLLCLESVSHSQKRVFANDIFESRYRLDTYRIMEEYYESSNKRCEIAYPCQRRHSQIAPLPGAY